MTLILIRLLQGLAALLLLGLAVVVVGCAWLMYRYDFQLLSVQTGSMAPAVNINDGLLSRPVRFKDLENGEMVTYRTKAGTSITHRITNVDYSARTITTKGDANTSPDAIISAEQIVSQPLAIVPHGGRIISVAKQPIVFLSLLYSLTLGLIGRELIRYFRNNQTAYRLPGY